jgi:hypothetical protein
MILNHAPRLNFNRWLDRTVVRDRGPNSAQELAAFRACNDNQRPLSTASLRRTRRPVLFCRWRNAPGGALECVWHTDVEAAGAGEEPIICHLDESPRRSVTRSTWPENYTVPSIEPSALTVYARPSSIRIVRVRRFV